jgi:hypothetical protein
MVRRGELEEVGKDHGPAWNKMRGVKDGRMGQRRQNRSRRAVAGRGEDGVDGGYEGTSVQLNAPGRRWTQGGASAPAGLTRGNIPAMGRDGGSQ